MTSPLSKMRIKAPHVLYAWNAPGNFAKTLGELPAGISLIHGAEKSYDSIHWFVRTKTDVDREISALLKKLRPGVTVWCYYPKSSSGVQTDLTRDKGWESLLKHDLKWLSLVSFDETWSAFAFRLKTPKEKNEAPPPERKIYKYADSATKKITLPADMAKAFTRNKEAKRIFEALPFSHRREYVEWVITAKREETRNNRIEGTMKKLLEGKKNPAEK